MYFFGSCLGAVLGAACMDAGEGFGGQFSNKKDIIILDRGYPSKAFIKNFIDKDIKFLMRLQKSSNLEIDACTKSDFYVEMQHERKIFKVRVIKFMLDSGETVIQAVLIKKVLLRLTTN